MSDPTAGSNGPTDAEGVAGEVAEAQTAETPAEATEATEAAPVAEGTAEATEAPAGEDAVPTTDEAAAEQTGDETASEPDAQAPAETTPTEATETTEAADEESPAEATTAGPADHVAPAEAETSESATGAGPEAGAETAGASAQPAAPRPAAPKPTALPRPGARPTPTALRRPAGGAQAPTAPAAPVAPVPPALDAAAVAAAEEFGRVDDEGNVFVREAAGERAVGQFPGVSPSEAMSLYVRRYLDLVAKVALFETRLESADLSVKEIDQTLARLREETAEPAAVGDLDSLRSRVDALGTRAAERRAALEEARAAAKAEAVAARTAIVEAAEKIAATDPQRMQWRPAGEELRRLLDRWKEAQRSGPRIDRATEESLWKRFSHARTAFDRERRHYFADLEQRNAAAKAAKEQLVAEAEALSTSTDWGATAGAFRDLMARWKAAGRAARRDDDALWARFRAAQDAFFAARDEQNAAVDAEYRENLVVKEQLLTEAEALVPVKDLAAAKAALRSIQERWEEAGKVPRGDVQRVEGRLRAVEQAVRDAEQARWVRTNPETRARAEGAAAQLEAAIEGLEAELEQARAAGNTRKAEDLETALAARRAWLEQVVRAAEESRG
ncbi:DUF349 domain-containing protein [Xylanimonas oleitrophica]|uniref:DUF349 domain-containing protein n=1 Tax=Xylanimonas oleitrophica TaxID=2607479 RepID=A0A2W5WPV3_9MICO|nr:DUF349 domain-containing protein [Xylanimonas oleitrophica]PZR52733.1 DUF349 domain-containing protein [Xylanimonas oleitrophica]